MRVFAVRRVRIIIPVAPLLIFDALPAEFDRSDIRRALGLGPRADAEKDDVATRRRIDRIVSALTQYGLAQRIPGTRRYRKAYKSLKSWAENYLGKLVWQMVKEQLAEVRESG